MQSFLSILIFAAIIGLVVFGWWYNSPKQKGKRGEKRVHNILSLLPDEYFILDDVVLKTEKGTTQIDHVIVSKYGIFTIETKNYRGEIYGDDNRKEWTQLIVTKVTYVKKWWKTYTYVTKNHFYNPVKQSVGHADLSNVESNHHVIYEDSLLDVIDGYKTTYLTDNDVQAVLAILNGNNIRETVSDRQHVKNIRKAAKEVNATINSGVCPKCGGHLVQRNGKYGIFFGCSNYPKCRFTTQ